MAISPKSAGPLFCKAFNLGFKGRRYPAGTRLGTGRRYCGYRFRESRVLVLGTVFADKKSMGQAFCAIYHPKGWKRV